jgi:hypothetical protein
MPNVTPANDLEWSLEYNNVVLSLRSFSAAICFADAVALKCQQVKVIQPDKRRISLVSHAHPVARTLYGGSETSKSEWCPGLDDQEQEN